MVESATLSNQNEKYRHFHLVWSLTGSQVVSEEYPRLWEKGKEAHFPLLIRAGNQSVVSQMSREKN
jgi:UDP-galactopyranose mutase